MQKENPHPTSQFVYREESHYIKWELSFFHKASVELGLLSQLCWNEQSIHRDERTINQAVAPLPISIRDDT
jgi:hypothetical protein